MIRAIIAVFQGAIAGMIGMFLAEKTADVATDERTRSAGRSCRNSLAMAFELVVMVGVGWGLWCGIAGFVRP